MALWHLKTCAPTTSSPFFLLNRIYQAQWLSKFFLSLVCPPLLRCSMHQETAHVPSIRWVRIPCSIKKLLWGRSARHEEYPRCSCMLSKMYVHRCESAAHKAFTEVPKGAKSPIRVVMPALCFSLSKSHLSSTSASQGDKVSTTCDTQAQKWYKSMRATCYQRCIHTGVILQATRPSRRRQRASNHPSN